MKLSDIIETRKIGSGADSYWLAKCGGITTSCKTKQEAEEEMARIIRASLSGDQTPACLSVGNHVYVTYHDHGGWWGFLKDDKVMLGGCDSRDSAVRRMRWQAAKDTCVLDARSGRSNLREVLAITDPRDRETMKFECFVEEERVKLRREENTQRRPIQITEGEFERLVVDRAWARRQRERDAGTW